MQTRRTKRSVADAWMLSEADFREYGTRREDE